QEGKHIYPCNFSLISTVNVCTFRFVARHFLIMILDAIAEKFAAMNRQFPNAVKRHKANARLENDEAMDVDIPQGEGDCDEIDIYQDQPIKLSTASKERPDPVAG